MDMSWTPDMSPDSYLGNTYCSRGHTHPPWNTTGVLKIAKCETVCGFCQKETKTAANLRKHVAIHIKNEKLYLEIAEGLSGRGRLEIQSSEDYQTSTSPRTLSPPTTEPETTGPAMSLTSNPPLAASAPGTLMQYQIPYNTTLIPAFSYPSSTSSSSYPAIIASSNAYFGPELYSPKTLPTAASNMPPSSNQKDLFGNLRAQKFPIKTAWTAIPSSQGFEILDYCKRNSVATSMPNSTGAYGDTLDNGPGGRGISHVPCYNRETLFDEEWQAHMKEVHGVYLLWPETWMKRIEVLDLEPFGGDIGACNEVIMDS